ncbi:enoyl-CoA delta isomerase 1, mitochondrial-like [Xenia sp. Carnegie-2017]|uniref:enoyl-CoA delta isomerase 1, mitochondrial-like n=1 Tax=Xenia sp. Carnegie-2017 TaxID=2897299 RepID=UPI001F0401EF|nr:enoyl-CoA delta isomerase 1, mitochondrial-like [Xenia sp. Carnegie-2017]
MAAKVTRMAFGKSRFCFQNSWAVLGNWHNFVLKPSTKVQPTLGICRLSTEATTNFVNVVNEGSYCIVEMKRSPVNSLNLEMMQELANVIENLGEDSSCKGMILTSAISKIFSAGLDITEFLSGDEDRLREFWKSFQNIWIKLYGSTLATIAAVNVLVYLGLGAAPAGGCLLALSCDYRIMASDASIGPNETQLGIVAPTWFADTIVNTLGHRKTEHILCLGQMLSSNEAKTIGLVDEVVKKDDLLSTAKKEIEKWLAIPDKARSITKLMLRRATLETINEQRGRY